MQLNNDGPSIPLTHEMTLGDLKRNMLLVGQAKIAVDFYDVDGFKISYCSKIKHVLEMPSFNMKIDNSVQYHC